MRDGDRGPFVGILVPQDLGARESSFWHFLLGERARRGDSVSYGQTLCVGGKTGTGDNRLHVCGSRGALMGSIGVSRTSAFVFFIGDRFFGTVVADVLGAQVGGYHFTSALPLQVFRPLVPKIRPLLEREMITSAQPWGPCAPRARTEPGSGAH